MSFGISVNDLPEQSTTVPSQEQFDGHGTSEKQSVVLDFMSSRHLNLSLLKPSILRFCNFFGDSHRAAEVSIGFLCKYSDNQRKLQSQLNGFLPK